MKLIQKIFSKPTPDAPAPAPTLPPRAQHPNDNPPSILEGSENATRSQLAHVLLRDLLRRHGIPAQWIDMKMLVVSSISRGAGLHMRLIVKQWDPRLMNYAQALQHEVMADAVRFDPQASQWLHGISWQLEMADSCPYTTLPDKAFWLDETTKQAAPMEAAAAVAPVFQALTARQAAEADEAEEDLNRLFFIRDQELERSSGDHAPDAYESTQPSPL
jgi:hypothetical protein